MKTRNRILPGQREGHRYSVFTGVVGAALRYTALMVFDGQHRIPVSSSESAVIESHTLSGVFVTTGRLRGHGLEAAGSMSTLPSGTRRLGASPGPSGRVPFLERAG